jgi:Secretion system C-terminal sorting domain
MKKFLLSSVLMLCGTALFAQTNQCPISFKRNNGNGGGFAGSITFTFASSVSSQLYVSTITEVGTTNTAVIAGAPSFKKNNTEVEYGFQSSNLGPAGNLIVNYFIDLDGDQFQDANEPGYQCNLTPQGPLPVTLVNFNASQRSSKVSLTWETLFELNNDGFEIERRVGNGAYQKIAFVDSKAPGGNGDAYSYSFEDAENLPKGVSYYRLRQVDLNGTASYSEIKAVRTGNGAIVLSVYPNPSRGTTNVALPSGVGTYDISVDDFTGKSVQRFSGLTTTNLQLNNLKPGMYMLRVSIRATGETITERIAVQ